MSGHFCNGRHEKMVVWQQGTENLNSPFYQSFHPQASLLPHQRCPSLPSNWFRHSLRSLQHPPSDANPWPKWRPRNVKRMATLRSAMIVQSVDREVCGIDDDKGKGSHKPVVDSEVGSSANRNIGVPKPYKKSIFSDACATE